MTSSFLISSFSGTIFCNITGGVFFPMASLIKLTSSSSLSLALYILSPCEAILYRLLTNFGMYFSIKLVLFSLLYIVAFLLRYIRNFLPIASRQYLISLIKSSSSANAFLDWDLNIKCTNGPETLTSSFIGPFGRLLS